MNKPNYTTREIESKYNVVMAYVIIFFSFAFTLSCFIFLYINTPHYVYKTEIQRFDFPKWTEWTKVTDINGKVIYCDEWLTYYCDSNECHIANFDIDKDGMCLIEVKIKEIK